MKKYISLIQWTRGQEKQIWALPLPILIGRGRHNTIVLNHSSLSRHHLRIRQQADAIVAEDLASKNGIRVNDSKVALAQLQDGDRVQIGPFVFQFSNEVFAPNVPLVQCPNPECQRVHPRSRLECGWCGYSLASAATLPVP